MKPLKQLFAAVCLCGALASCSSGSDPYQSVEYYPVKIDGNSDWSFVGPDGKIICEDTYSETPSCVVSGYFSVEENEGYTIYKLNGGKPSEVPGLTGLACAGYYIDGMMGVVKDSERITFVDGNGKTVLTLEPIGKKEVVIADPQFYDGLLLVKLDDGKWGYLDKNGKMAIKAVYDGATSFKDGYALAVKEDDEGNEQIVGINTKGDVLFKTKKNYKIRGFHDGIIAVRETTDDGERRYGFLDMKGEFKKMPSKVCDIEDFTKKLFIFENSDGKCGLMNMEGEVIISAKYSSLRFIDDYSRLLSCKDDKYKILNLKGDEVESEIDNYKSIWALPGKGFNFFGKDGSTYYLLDSKGAPIGKEEFRDYSTALSKTSYLESDYFPTDDVVKDIVAYINEDGVGKYTLGSKASRFLSDPSSHSNTYYFTPDSEDYDYEATYHITPSRISCSHYIAEFDYDPYYETWRYMFNDYSTIDGGTATCSANTRNLWKKVKAPLTDTYMKRGFRVVDTDSGAIHLKKDDVDLYLQESGRDISITVSNYAPAEVEEVAVADDGWY